MCRLLKYGSCWVLGDVIDSACVVDLAGKVILEYLLNVSGHEALVLGLAEFKEIIATTTSYLWWERRKFCT